MEIIIYKIYCKNNEIKDCYIGSTGNIKTRIQVHKYSCNNENSEKYNQYKYVYIRENGGFNNWDFKILCKCPKEDRYKMERWYIENCKESNLNKSIPTRTHKEYYQKNKEKINEYQKEYDKKNKETTKQKMTCICGSIFRICDKSRHCKTLKHQKYIENNQTI